MIISICELRKLIREEVERNMRWSAGMFGGGLSKGTGKGVIEPPPGLGNETNSEEFDSLEYGKEEQEESPTAVRVDNRTK